MKNTIIILVSFLLLVGCAPFLNDIQTQKTKTQPAISGSFPTTTNTLTPTPTSTLTSTPTSTLAPTPTPFGGSSKILIQAWKYYDVNPKIYLINNLASEAKLIFDDYVIASVNPDGRKMLVFKVRQKAYFDSQAELYITNVDGSNPVLISNKFMNSRLSHYFPSAGWIEGTDKVVFRGMEKSGLVQLFLYEDNGSITQITHSQVGVFGLNYQLINNGIYWSEGTGYEEYAYYWSNIYGKEFKKVIEQKDTGYYDFAQRYGVRSNYSPNGQYNLIGNFQHFTIYHNSDSTEIDVSVDDLIKNNPEGITISYSTQNMLWYPTGDKFILWLGYESSDVINQYGDNTLYIVSLNGTLINKISLDKWFEFPNITKNFVFGSFIEAMHNNGGFSPDGKIFITQIRQPVSGSIKLNGIINLESGDLQIIKLGIPEESYISKFYWLP